VGAVASHRGFAATPRSRAVNVSIGSQRSFVSRACAVLAFATLLFLNIALPAWKVGGIPVRGFLAGGLLVGGAILYSREAHLALKRNALLLALAGGLAVLGIVVSIANGTSLVDIAEAVTEVHLQGAITILVAAMLAQVCGARAAMIAVLLILGASAVVAVFQMLGVHAAWNLRLWFGHFAHDAIQTANFYEDKRPMGISFSPTQLAAHMCLAFAVFAGVRDKERQARTGRKIADPAVVIALVVFFTACVASATRSPILGGMIFLCLYLAMRRGSWVPVAVLIGGSLLYIASPLIIDAVQSNAPRVMRTDDNSAAARLVFAYYGTRLFLDNPLGYGLMFEPYSMWTKYWSDLYMMKAAAGAQIRDLHNFALSMLNIYGIGIVLFTPVIIRLLKSARASLIFFVPYAVHIMFHNSGPFYNDNILWFITGAISAASVSPAPFARMAFGRGAQMVRQPLRTLSGEPAFNPRLHPERRRFATALTRANGPRLSSS